MAIRISGPGVGLPYPRAVLPENRDTVGSFTPETNRFSLESGQTVVIPAGMWIVQSHGGVNSVLEFFDPVTQEWQPFLPAALSQPGEWGMALYSDGFSYRVLNTSQVGTAAIVTAPGTGYVQATTTVTPSTGNSTWVAIVGGAIGSLIVTAPGSGYTIPPTLYIQAPPPPGFPARGTVTLAADGSVSGVTLVSGGAGYKQTPLVRVVESLFDPNIDNIDRAGIVAQLTGAGTITAVLLKEFGAPLPAAPSLTISGSGSGATAVVSPTAWIAPSSETIVLQRAPG